VVKKLMAIKNVDWYNMPGPYKWGTLIKKSKFVKETDNPITKEAVSVQRSCLSKAFIDFEKVNQEELLKLIECKYSNDVSLFHALFEPAESTKPPKESDVLETEINEFLEKFQASPRDFSVDSDAFSLKFSKALAKALKDKGAVCSKLLIMWRGLSTNPSVFVQNAAAVLQLAPKKIKNKEQDEEQLVTATD